MQTAYEVLSDPEGRAIYDDYGAFGTKMREEASGAFGLVTFQTFLYLQKRYGSTPISTLA